MEDGKLINAAPFDSYLLRCLRRAMMKRQINDSLCVIRIEHVKGEERWKGERKPPSVPMKKGKDGMKPQSTASMFRCFAAVDWRWPD